MVFYRVNLLIARLFAHSRSLWTQKHYSERCTRELRGMNGTTRNLVPRISGERSEPVPCRRRADRLLGGVLCPDVHRQRKSHLVGFSSEGNGGEFAGKTAIFNGIAACFSMRLLASTRSFEDSEHEARKSDQL